MATDTSFVKLPPNLNIANENAASEWKFWLRTFEDYLVVIGKNKAEDGVKLSLLRNMMGPEATRILSTIPISKPKDENKYEDVIATITAHVNPRTNVVFERFKFNERRQREGESFENFMTDCRHLIQSCDYKTMEEEMMRDHIVQTVFDKATQEALLRVDDLTLNKTIQYCQTKEQAAKQVSAMHPAAVEAAKVSRQQEQKKSTFNCRRCQTEHGPRSCPAFGKKCKKCGTLNHFAVSCKKANKKVQEVSTESTESSSTSESENVHCGEAISINGAKSEWYENIMIENSKVKYKLDTGADVSIMPVILFNKINENLNLKLLPTNI